jgi:hypothetical protein
MITANTNKPRKQPKPTGYIVYKGPSILDGAPIVMLLTTRTNNRKTGDMVQTWIIRDDMSPLDASKKKLDSSICGNCPHKWSVGGACYVNLGQAPTAIYKAYKRGAYMDLTDPAATPLRNQTLGKILHNRKVRLGAYGDPAAVPVQVLRDLVTFASGHTGYTHQMRHKNFDPEVLQYCMASTETLKTSTNLWADKARTFRIVRDISDLMPGEIECLADAKGMSCTDCMLCGGKTNTDSNTKPRPNIAIVVHGSRASKF